MQTRFAGKTIIITGGGSGIGLATAIRVASESPRLTLVGTNLERLAEAEKTLLDQLPDAEILTAPADVSEEAQVESVIDRTITRFGMIDGLFNNAGLEGPLVPLHEYPTGDFEHDLESGAV
jgi:NAD(P)-dependent dehydrogenase (short-subunit alcohol dehydrogenase family)